MTKQEKRIAQLELKLLDLSDLLQVVVHAVLFPQQLDSERRADLLLLGSDLALEDDDSKLPERLRYPDPDTPEWPSGERPRRFTLAVTEERYHQALLLTNNLLLLETK